jgi:hypothetical protein
VGKDEKTVCASLVDAVFIALIGGLGYRMPLSRSLPHTSLKLSCNFLTLYFVFIDMRWLLFLSIFLGGNSLLQAQLPPGVLDRFSLQSVGRTVRVDLTLSAGFTCNGIVITRSTDSSQFEGIGLIGGICGDSAVFVNYSFIDSQPPLNQKLYYQVLLGGRIPTEVKSIVVLDFREAPIRVQPNPAREQVRFEFEALEGQQHELLVFDVWGKPVARIQAESGQAQMQVYDLAAGFFLVRRSDRPWEFARLLISK